MARRVIRGWDRRRLTRLRDKQGWSEAELGRLARVSPQAIRNWESGVTTGPQVDMLARVAAALGASMSDLVKVPPRDRYLSDLRVLAGLVQPEAARLLGVSTGYYSDLERGEKNLSDQHAAAIAKLFQTTPDVVRAAHERARLRPPGTPA